MRNKVYWPTREPYVVGCDPIALAAIAIMRGCDDAPYTEGANCNPSEEEIAFWNRVKENRKRIAQWVISGLVIEGRAIELPAVDYGGKERPESITAIIAKMPTGSNQPSRLVRNALDWLRQDLDPIDKGRKFLLLLSEYRAAVTADGSEEPWREAYDVVFGGALGAIRDHVFDGIGLQHPDYYDPDTSYEEDVTAWLDAQKTAVDEHLKGYAKNQKMI